MSKEKKIGILNYDNKSKIYVKINFFIHIQIQYPGSSIKNKIKIFNLSINK